MAYEDRKGRLKVHSAKLNNTDGNARNDYFKIQTANLLLRRSGVQLIANDRSFHIYEEWPGMDRRRGPRKSAVAFADQALTPSQKQAENGSPY